MRKIRRILLELGAWLALVFVLVLGAGTDTGLILFPFCFAIIASGRVGSVLGFAIPPAWASVLAAIVLGAVVGAVLGEVSLWIAIASPVSAFRNEPGAGDAFFVVLLVYPLLTAVPAAIVALIASLVSRRLSAHRKLPTR